MTSNELTTNGIYTNTINDGLNCGSKYLCPFLFIGG